MTDTEYMSIRGEQNFLYRYYCKLKGTIHPENYFNQMLAFWLQAAIGVHPTQGLHQIINYLDAKYNFNKS